MYKFEANIKAGNEVHKSWSKRLISIDEKIFTKNMSVGSKTSMTSKVVKKLYFRKYNLSILCFSKNSEQILSNMVTKKISP